jgi:hypothetical protein
MNRLVSVALISLLLCSCAYAAEKLEPTEVALERRLTPSELASRCSSYCVEYVFTRDHALVFLVDETGGRRQVGSVSAPAEFAVGASTAKIVLVEQVGSAAAKNTGCGADGWGWALGEVVFAALANGVQTQGTYIGAGNMSVMQSYGGTTSFTVQDSPVRSSANIGYCQTLREMYGKGSD